MDAISMLERKSIIHTLTTEGKWEGERRGAHVRIYQFEGHDKKLHINFFVGFGSFNTTAPAETPEAAIDAINSVFAGEHKPAAPLIPAAILHGMNRAPYRLPYKDQEL